MEKEEIKKLLMQVDFEDVQKMVAFTRNDLTLSICFLASETVRATMLEQPDAIEMVPKASLAEVGMVIGYHACSFGRLSKEEQTELMKELRDHLEYFFKLLAHGSPVE